MDYNNSIPYPTKSTIVKTLLAIILCCVLTLPSVAQRGKTPYWQMMMLRKQRSSNIDFSFGGGCAQLIANGKILDPIHPGATIQMNAAYTYLWDRLSGIRLGLGMTYAHNGLNIDINEMESIGSIELFDNASTVVRTTHFTTTTNGIQERYDLLFLTIPAYFVYQSEHFYSNIGLQLMIPLVSSANYDYGNTTIGVGRQIDGTGTTLRRPIEMKNIDGHSGNYKISSFSEGKTNLMNIAASFAIGYRYALNAKQIINFVFYANIGLNSAKNSGEDFVSYTNGEYEQNNYLQSNSISTLRYLDIGLRATYNFTFGKRIRTSNPYRSPTLKYRSRY